MHFQSVNNVYLVSSSFLVHKEGLEKRWFLKNIYSASLDWIGKLKLQLLMDYNYMYIYPLQLLFLATVLTSVNRLRKITQSIITDHLTEGCTLSL